MLLQFTVENFLSFRDSTTLSMLAAEGVDHDERQTILGPQGRKLLRCAAIYGANASGKSNLVQALDFACHLIFEGTKAGGIFQLRPFKLDPRTSSAPSRFEFEVSEQDLHYSYGFEITNEFVVGEWLYVVNNGEERPLFERSVEDEQSSISHIHIANGFADSDERQQFLRFVAQGTRPNQLFLTEALEHNVKELDPLFAAMRGFSVVWPGASFKPLMQTMDQDPSFREFLVKLMKDASTGIEDVEIERSEVDATAFPKGFIERLPLETSETQIRRTTAEKLELAMILSSHRAYDGNLIKFTLDEESDGTRRLLHLAPALYFLRFDQKRRECIFVFDEIERSLHPLLTRLFLQRFLASDSKDAPNQMIFTTHDTNLLDLSLLSRDSIWFTEKDLHGASVLYSLADFKSEQLAQLGNNLEQGYLQGRFGAIPFLGDPVRLSWKRSKQD